MIELPKLVSVPLYAKDIREYVGKEVLLVFAPWRGGSERAIIKEVRGHNLRTEIDWHYFGSSEPEVEKILAAPEKKYQDFLDQEQQRREKIAEELEGTTYTIHPEPSLEGVTGVVAYHVNNLIALNDTVNTHTEEHTKQMLAKISLKSRLQQLKRDIDLILDFL